MPNIYGTAMPFIYGDGENINFQMAVMDEGGKNIRFQKELTTWKDFNGVIQTRIEGFRLIAEFNWSYISPTDLGYLSTIDSFQGQLFIKFPSIPRKYPFYVESLEEGLQEENVDEGDSARLVIKGTHLISEKPNLDSIFVITSPYYRILNTS